MSRLVPYRDATIGQDAGPGGVAPPVSARLEAIGKFVPAEILAFYLPASGAAVLAGADLAMWLQWITFFIGWFAVPAYFLWIARGDERGWRQALVSWVAFPIWVMASNAFWPLRPWILPNPALALWLLAVFSLLSAFLLPTRNETANQANGLHA